MLVTPIPAFMPTASGSWTPASLGTALIAWYKADTGVTTSGANVTGWADQSGNGVNLTCASSNPQYNATGFNSKPAITWSGAQNSLNSSTDACAPGAVGTLSIFVVMQFNTPTNNGGLFSYEGTGQTADWSNIPSFRFCAQTTPTIGVFRNSSYIAPDSVVNVTNYRAGMIFDGANLTPYLNNVAGTPAASTGTFGSSGTLFVGSSPDGTKWTGPVAEIVFTNTALSSTDRNNLDTYFKNKWGL